MKLHRLEITGMGPYAGKVSVDFDRLDEAGVYLLTGPTGSGKTTVLDAVAYAFFGQIPRAAKGAEVVSDHRELETTPVVRLEATVGGTRLRITRSPEHQRPKAKGEGSTSESQSLVIEEHANEHWRQLTGKWGEGNELLTERIGMNADQFGQVVMLPQGDFAKFLKANVNDRKALLERLFPGADLAWLEAWLIQRAKSDRKTRDEKQQEINDCFQAVKPIAAGLLAEELPEEDALPDTVLATPALEWIEKTEGRLQAIDAEAERVRTKAAEAAKRADTELKDLSDRSVRIGLRREAEKKKLELEGRAGWRKETVSEIEAAEKAAGVKLLAHSARELQENSRLAGARLSELTTEIASNELTGGKAEEDLPALEKELRSGATTIINFENDELPKRRELEGRIERLKVELTGLEDTGPGSPIGRAEARVGESEEAANKARQTLIEIRNARTAGMAAELARGLEEGQPCVVCGSTEHPSPAHGDELEFTREDEERAEKIADAAATAANEARTGLATARAENEQQKLTTAKQIKDSENDLGKLAAREQDLAAGASSVGERRAELEEAADLIDGFLKAQSTARDSAENASKAEAAAAQEAARAGFDSVEVALEAAREKSHIDRLKKECESYDKSLAIVNDQLTGALAEVDPNEELDLEPARNASLEAGKVRDEKSEKAGVARSNLMTFRTETAPVAGLYEELEPLTEASARSDSLSRLTCGDNERRMKLSIFVLATRLRQVITAANVHLQKMTDQRYHLVYSGDLAAHGATSGLGIEVHDAQTSKVRPTATLSGGEGFCASLSLALGLAEIVQMESGGKRLETLFIDEGFGTLDTKSLDQVMDVIDSLREGGRSVGLVSHVEELRNRIPAQIQVIPGPQGSDLRVECG